MLGTYELYCALFMLTLTTSSLLLLKKRRARKYAVRPINRRRKEKGMFDNVLKSMLKQDHKSFFKYCRMTPKQFFSLLRMVEPHLQKKYTKCTLLPAQRLIITLHYLAEGCSMQELAWGHMIGHSTVCIIIHETTKIIWDTLAPVYLKPPSIDNWIQVSKGFYKRWNVPNCIGAVDGKHISIQAPYHGGSMYFNYKKHHSIVLMASCDAFYRFIAVDIGAPGSQHDSVVFQESGFGQAILKNQCEVPPARRLPNTQDVTLPHFFVADAAFPLNLHIMRPYPQQNAEEKVRVFNYRLSRARRTIENTFGILAQRWRILRKPIIAKVDTCQSIVLATVVLHNYIQKTEEDIPVEERQYCPTGYVDSETPDGNVTPGAWRDDRTALRSVGRLGANNSQRDVRINRDLLCNYFNSDAGSVPWQLESIMKSSLPDRF